MSLWTLFFICVGLYVLYRVIKAVARSSRGGRSRGGFFDDLDFGGGGDGGGDGGGGD